MKIITMLITVLSLAGVTAAVSADTAASSSETSEAPAASTIDTPVANNPDLQSVANLGKISVEGHQSEVLHSLQVIKRALNTALSDDPVHADDVVCRMNRVSGYPTQAFLRCSTNRELIHERVLMQTHQDMSVGGEKNPAASALKHLVGRDPTRAVFSRVDAAQLQELLLKIKCDGCKDSGLVVGDGE
jgi:hypothetical protein